MNRPTVEVADLLRKHGDRFVRENRSWLGYSPGPANTASIGLNPFQLLSLALDRMQESGLPRGKGRQGTEYFAWSAVRELALLVLEGPLHATPPQMVLALGERLVVLVERGLG